MDSTNDQSAILGLWASSVGPVLWVRPARGHSVYVSIAPSRDAHALALGMDSRDSKTVVGRWDDYDQELRVPLPRFPDNAELILDIEYWGSDADGCLSPSLSSDGAEGRDNLDIPKWLLPEPGYKRVREAHWPEYAITRRGGIRKDSAGG